MSLDMWFPTKEQFKYAIIEREGKKLPVLFIECIYCRKQIALNTFLEKLEDEGIIEIKDKFKGEVKEEE